MEDDVLTMSKTYGFAAAGQSWGFMLKQSKAPLATGSAATIVAAQIASMKGRRRPIVFIRPGSPTAVGLSIRAGAEAANVNQFARLQAAR